MSLKAFHIIFVTVSTLFAIFFGIWAVKDYRTSGAVGSLWLAIGSFVAVVVLVWYGRWFLKKLKGVGYL